MPADGMTIILIKIIIKYIPQSIKKKLTLINAFCKCDIATTVNIININVPVYVYLYTAHLIHLQLVGNDIFKGKNNHKKINNTKI